MALDDLGRNDAVQMSFEEAVRAYLDHLDAKLTRDGVILHGQLYKSPAFDAAKVRSAISGGQSLPVKVYFMEACIRHTWLEWKGQLIELDLASPTPVGNDVIYMSMEELKQFEEFCRQRERVHKGHRQAVSLQTYQEFKENVGKELDSGSRVRGRPKRGTRLAKLEANEARNASKGKKAA